MIDEKKIQVLINEELNLANMGNPLFTSDHEAWAVAKEEIEETEVEMEAVKLAHDRIWYRTKQNADTFEAYAHMKNCAIKLIQEAIQIAAMCDKAVMSRTWREGGDI